VADQEDPGGIELGDEQGDRLAEERGWRAKLFSVGGIAALPP